MKKVKTVDDLSIEELKVLAKMALCVSLEAPEKRSKYSVSAMVTWSLIEEIRLTTWEVGLYPWVYRARLMMKKLKREKR